MSEKQKFITVRVEWRMLLRPVCAMRGHVWDQFLAISVWHSNDWFCKRCGTRRPAGHRESDADGSSWWQQLDQNGKAVASTRCEVMQWQWTPESALVFFVCATLDVCHVREDAPPVWAPVLLDLADCVMMPAENTNDEWAQLLPDQQLAQYLQAIADDVEEEIIEHPEVSAAVLREAAQRFRKNAGERPETGYPDPG